MDEFYQYGIDRLDKGQFAACAVCERMFSSKSLSEEGVCSGCSKKRSGKDTKTRRVSSESELEKQGGKLKEYEEAEEYKTWKFICSLAFIAKPDFAHDRPSLHKWAYIQFKQETGHSPPREFRFVEATEIIPVDLKERILKRYHDWKSIRGIKDERLDSLVNRDDPKWQRSQSKQGTMEFLESMWR